MNDIDAQERTKDDDKELVLQYDLDAPPEKVWRAISIPEFRERWLPSKELADGQPISSIPGEEVRYRIRDDEPPFLESEVRFQIRPNPDGGTALKIVHAVTSIGHRSLMAANDDCGMIMRAA